MASVWPGASWQHVCLKAAGVTSAALQVKTSTGCRLWLEWKFNTFCKFLCTLGLRRSAFKNAPVWGIMKIAWRVDKNVILSVENVTLLSFLDITLATKLTSTKEQLQISVVCSDFKAEKWWTFWGVKHHFEYVSLAGEEEVWPWLEGGEPVSPVCSSPLCWLWCCCLVSTLYTVSHNKTATMVVSSIYIHD